MQFLPNRFYHIYNQGNNKQPIFREEEDYNVFTSLYKKLIVPHCSTIAWCLMPNHFHSMILTDERCNIKTKQGGLLLDPITNGTRKLLSGHARIFNARYEKTGSLFRQKTKSKCLSEIKIIPGTGHGVQDYYVNCFNYIHQNPLVAGLVDKLEDWEYSSYKDYAELRIDGFCQKDLAAIYCDYSPDNFVRRSYERVEKKLVDLFI